MKTVHVRLGKRSYDILIAPGMLARVPDYFHQYGISKRLFLIANPVVFELFGESLLGTLTAAGFDTTEILVPDGEKYKTLQTVENIYTYLIVQGADRNSTIVALGGGVTGDVAGFVAATFHRGIAYVQIPTTLLAQVDSSVGGKTGVNHRLGKNLIGAFYQPSLVCIDVNTVGSLPQREFESGLYEVVKYGLIYDLAFFEYLETRLEAIRRREAEVLENIISRCCEIKAEVISIDETEQDLRRILNFGHTFGHALETAAGYIGITHGEAVAYGMMAAGLLSNRLGYIDTAACDRIMRCIGRIGTLPSISEIPLGPILEAMARDKKRQHDRIHFVLLKEIGSTLIRSDFDEAVLADVWERVKAERL